MDLGDRMARHSLAERIERFVTRLEKANRQPTAFEAARVVEAIDDLVSMEYSAGADLMRQVEIAEKAPFQVVPFVLRRRVSAQELRVRLNSVFAEEWV